MHLDVFNSLRWKKYHDLDGLPGKLLCKRQSWIFSSRGKSYANGRAGAVTFNMFFPLIISLCNGWETIIYLELAVQLTD